MSEQAIGYFFTAFFGALAALVASWVREWIRRPKLRMEIDLSALRDFRVIDNALEVPRRGSQIFMEKDMRLRIHNDGKTPAEYCEAKIEPLNERGESLFDPSILHWVRRYLEPQISPQNTFAPITINAKDHEFLAMIVIYQERVGNIENLHLQTASHRPFPFGPNVNYQFKVTIFAKNHNPISKTFSLLWDGTWDGFNANSIRQTSP
jgi:hypothetical protein